MRVGVRELSHHTSQYLSRVKNGEVLDVTEHGRVIATISPAVSPATGASAAETARPRPRAGGGRSGDPAAARTVDEFLAKGFGKH